MQIRDQIQHFLRQAQAAESRGDTEAAKSAFRAAIRYMESFAMEAVSEEARRRRIERIQVYRARLAALDGKPDAGAGASSSTVGRRPTAGGATAKPTPAPSSSLQQADNEYRVAARELICRTTVKWDDIGGLDEVRRDLSTGFALALADREDNVRVDGFRNIMLYGPPGTGKTIVAAAVSNQLDATFFNVKASSLLSKYFGESTKLVDALYAEAKSSADEGLAVVFIDEFDALCPPRETNTTGPERRLLSTLLSVLDGLSEKGEDPGVITLAATNVPWSLDEAILSRFQKRIFIGYPSAEQRQAILIKTLSGRGLSLAEGLEVQRLADQTDWFSGRDLESLVRHASSLMIRRCNPELGQLADRGRDAMKTYRLVTKPLTASDFDESLRHIAVDPQRRQAEQSRFDGQP